MTFEALVQTYDTKESSVGKTPLEGKVLRVKGKVAARRVDAAAGSSILTFIDAVDRETSLQCPLLLAVA